MEDLCRRFPVVAQNVFANLDEKSLTDCKVVSKVSCDFLNNERFFWIRIIKKNFVYQNKFFKEWKTAFSRTPIAILKQMASAVGQICRQQCNLSISYLSPLHITARYGNFTLFGYIFDKMIEKSPKGFYKLTPLHIAAMYGHFEVCKDQFRPGVVKTPVRDIIRSIGTENSISWTGESKTPSIHSILTEEVQDLVISSTLAPNSGAPWVRPTPRGASTSSWTI